ncbi:MAG: hypothetical protein JWM33_3538, partial [Caulobacteraceae bacterium]|nr:hypothetical protein [Caulobacteraceae bacterium]
MARSYSISNRLIWSLSIAQVLALTIGTLGILLSIVLLLPRNPDPMAGIAPMIAESVVVHPDGALTLKPSPRLAKALNQQPDLWAAMRLRDGRQLRYGTIPPQAEPLIAELGVMPAGFFQTNKSGDGMTILPMLQVPGLGKADIVFGGLSAHSYWLVGLLAYFRVIFIPLLIATVLMPT